MIAFAGHVRVPKMCYSWAEQYPDLHSMCTRFNLTEIQNPVQFTYYPLEGLLQEGPQCGLVALAIVLSSPNRETVDKLLSEARQLGYSRNGEMFSAKNMFVLAKQYVKQEVIFHEDLLDSDYIREFLLSGGLMLVPYVTFHHLLLILSGSNQILVMTQIRTMRRVAKGATRRTGLRFWASW